jgi:hypothetical protein
MKRIIMLAIVSVMLLVSTEGCMWRGYGTVRGGTTRGHDSDKRQDSGKRQDSSQGKGSSQGKDSGQGQESGQGQQQGR